MNKTKINIYYILALFLLFSCIIQFPYFDFNILLSAGSTIISSIILSLILFKKNKLLKKYKKVNFLVILFIVCVLISGFINRELTINKTLLTSFIFALSVFNVFYSFELFYEEDKLVNIMKMYAFILTVFLIINNILMLFFPSLFITHGEYYFLGNKFKIAYLHCFDIIFINYFDPSKKKYIYISLILTCLFTNCVSGIVLFIILILFDFFSGRIKKMSPVLSILVLIISGVIAITFEQFINYSFVNYIVNVVFDKSSTIHSRLYIYQHVVDILNNKPLFGYGFNNSNVILSKLGIGVNTQNSIFETIFQFGWIGLISLLLLTFNVFKNKKILNNKSLVLTYSLIIGYFVLSSIEITLNIYFIFLTALFNVGRE